MDAIRQESLKAPAIRPAESTRFRTSTLEVEVVTDLASFMRLKPEWDTLTAAMEHPFVTHDWIRLWIECFARGRPLRVIVIREGAALVGAAPMLIDTQHLFGFRMRTLTPMWNALVPRWDFVVSEQRPDIYRAIWAQVASERPNWDLLLLPQLPDDAAILSEFNDAASVNGFAVTTRDASARPFVTISGTWKDYLGALPASLQWVLRNRTGRLSQQGPLEREMIGAASGKLAVHVEQAFHAADSGDKKTNTESRRLGESFCRFFTKLADAPEMRDALQMRYLRCGETRIAYDLSLRFNDVVYVLKSGALPEYAEHAPLQILTSLNLEHCFRDGIRRYDFVGMEEDWSAHWRCSAAPLHWMFVYPNSPRTALFHAMKFNPGAIIEEWTSLQESNNRTLRHDERTTYGEIRDRDPGHPDRT